MRSTHIKTPALIILLGTTPALAGVEFCQQMLGHDDDDRRSVALVHIDTDDLPPRVSGFYREHEGKFAVFSSRLAVPVGINHADDIADGYFEGLTADEVSRIRWHTYIPTKTPQYFDNGAGGIRNNGHVALCYHHGRVLGRLEEALNTLERLSAAQGERVVDRVAVYIIAFLGGGTGSGTAADVAVMVRRMIERRQYGQRITLYSILPGDHITGAIETEKNWRKSNSTAALLEIVAHGLAAGNQDGYYPKYLLDKLYRIRLGPIVNEILLMGRTNMETVEQTAAIVGLDLYQRVTDASGIGAKESSAAPDRRQLADSDDRYLPTCFGTSCPFEVRFPAGETAQAFAEYSASFLLTALLGTRPRLGDISGNQSDWRKKWSEVARQPNLPKLPVSQFLDAKDSKLNLLWDKVAQHKRGLLDAITQDVDDQRAREEHAIRTARTADELRKMMPPVEGNDLSNPITRRTLHLELMRAEYEEARQQLRETAPGNADESRPTQLEDKLANGVPYIPVPIPWIDNAWDDKYANAVCAKYNAIIRRYYYRERHKALEKLLKDLHAQVEAQLNADEAYYSGVSLEKTKADLRRRSYERSAWLGKLEQEHPHFRHIFELPIIPLEPLDTRQQVNSAVRGLYLWATSAGQRTDDAIGGASGTFERQRDAALSLLHARFREQWRGDLGASADGLTADESGEALTADELQTYRATQLATVVVETLRTIYLAQFRRANLFELLEVGIAAAENRSRQMARRRVSAYLLAHLVNMQRLVRDLVIHEPELWLNGSEKLLTTLYLGINSVSDRGDQEALAHALREIGPLAERAERPFVSYEQDPHRLQLNYSQHGVSIRTLPEYYRRYDDSSMQHFYENQTLWAGNGVIGQGGTYGANKMPVHSSGEMETLVWTPGALGHPQSLVERFIRPDRPGGSGQGGRGGGGSGPRGGNPARPSGGQPSGGYGGPSPSSRPWGGDPNNSSRSYGSPPSTPYSAFETEPPGPSGLPGSDDARRNAGDPYSQPYFGSNDREM
ncbi:MAG: tubulin-like doman-containing protein [Ktedonobacterales bacterium]